MVDVNMSDATTATPSTSTSTDNSLAESIQLLNLLRHNLSLLERSVKHLEPRFTSRVLRTLTAARKRDTKYPNVLARAVIEGTQNNDQVRNHLLNFLPQPFNPPNSNGNGNDKNKDKDSDLMQIDSTTTTTPATTENKVNSNQVDQPHIPLLDAEPELQAYLRLLVVILLVDSNKLDQVSEDLKQEVKVTSLAISLASDSHTSSFSLSSITGTGTISYLYPINHESKS